MRALLLIVLLGVACNPIPALLAEAGAGDNDASGDAGGDAAGSRITVAWDRPFGSEGEVPSHLAAGKAGHSIAVTNRAVHYLDDQGRLTSRVPLPLSSSGAAPIISSAAWDGSRTGLTMSWPGLTTGGNPWRLLGVAGSGAPPLIHGGGLAMSATCHNALGSSLGSTQMVLYEQLQSGKKEIRLLLANLSKIAGGSKPVSVPLQSGLALTASVGDWGVLSDGTTFFCATLAGEGIALWTQSKGHKPNGYTKALIHTGTRSALGRCRAVGSGKSFITAYTVTAKPYAELDLGPGAPDMGVKGVGYGEPTARVLPPSGNQISPPLRLSHRGGNLLLQDLIWDGSRFLALVNAVDQRGGRLLLTALDETGRLILRDLEIPLAYEPGRLLAGKLTADANGYTLLYASRRPWDAGVLHLVRFSVKW